MAVTNKSTLDRENMQGIILADQVDADDGELEVDMIALMYRLIERLKWIIAAAVLGGVLMGVYTTNFVTPKYKSTAKLYVVNPADSVINVSALNLGNMLAADYVQVFKNWHVAEKVKTTLDLPYSHRTIQDMVSVEVLKNTRIISITVTSKDPQEAHDIAMAYAEFAPAFIEAKMETDRPNIFEEAKVPTIPSSPNMARNIFLGLIAGGLAAAVFVVVQFIVDDRVRTADMLERRLGLPVLGMMPVVEGDMVSRTPRKGKRAGKGEVKA